MPIGHGKAPPGAMKNLSNDHLTPPSLLQALGALSRDPDEPGGWELGKMPFACDPCSSRQQPWPTAKVMWDADDNGLTREWRGETWCNPPYGAMQYAWLTRLAAHGDGMALLYARTDTAGFHAHVWDKADAVFFFSGRMYFHWPVTGERAPNNCGGPLVLAAYGAKAVKRLERLTAKDSRYPGMAMPLPKGRA